MHRINILHEDDLSIIINKPAGLAVQGGKGINFSLDEYFRNFGAVLVHRLDRDTSGVLLAAKGLEANRFSRIFGTERKAVKLYTAVCAGRPEHDKGIIKDELLIRGSLKKSETRFKLIKTGSITDINLEYSVLELELETGRMHQIRRHLSMNGNPVLGDDKYGDFQLNKKLRKSAGLKHLLLHASRLIIKEEFNIDVTAPLPEYFKPFI
ncbi:MAG: RluA family pseudouridine synthase [Treponema sp.]|nr:RluA family pseudouridine synthase [Treponema sp.]